MRFVDFADDIRQTSYRISERGLPIDVNYSCRLTIKTLYRNDVVDFFDQLLDQTGAKTGERHSLIFYIVIFCYIVNISPRHNNMDLSSFSNALIQKIKKIDIGGPNQVTFSSSRKINISDGIGLAVRSIFGFNRSNFICKYYKRVNVAHLMRLKSYIDACLILYEGETILMLDESFSGRVIYNDRIFISKDYSLNCLYLSSAG